MFDLDKKFNLISLMNIFLILLIVVQIVNFKNFVFPNIQNEVRYSNELQKESKFIDYMENTMKAICARIATRNPLDFIPFSC